MKVLRRIEDLRAWRRAMVEAERSVTLVPTMGNLHAGHLSLVEQGRLVDEGTATVVSIFVNPLQFEDAGDLARYPRTEEEDLAKLEGVGVEAVFLPTADELYPANASGHSAVGHSAGHSTIEVGPLATVWEGASRPGHFNGVATVVAKLFNLVQPQRAIFGQKDYQQLLVIRQIVRDFNWPIEIVAAPIRRDHDGLALSSRNRFLTADERTRAGTVIRALRKVAEELRGGAAVDQALDSGHELLTDAGFMVDYLAFCDSNDLSARTSKGSGVLIVAARLGSVRLLDNLSVE